jgi:hypothetical protein
MGAIQTGDLIDYSSSTLTDWVRWTFADTDWTSRDVVAK